MHEQVAVQHLTRRQRFWIAVGCYKSEVGFAFYLFYCRWFYRAHMRWLHKRDRHWWRHYRLIDGPKFDKCEWCGAMKYPDGSGVFPAPLLRL